MQECAHNCPREQRATKKTPLEAFAGALNQCIEVTPGMTKATLARLIGCSASAMGNYARGQDEPNPRLVFAMEEALGLAPGTLSHFLGYGPLNNGGHRPPGVIEAVTADPLLDKVEKQSLVGLYRALVDPRA